MSVLQFFYVYLQRLSPAALVDAWPALLSLLKDGLSLLDLVPQVSNLLSVLQYLISTVNSFVPKNPVDGLSSIDVTIIRGSLGRGSIAKTVREIDHVTDQPTNQSADTPARFKRCAYATKIPLSNPTPLCTPFFLYLPLPASWQSYQRSTLSPHD